MRIWCRASLSRGRFLVHKQKSEGHKESEVPGHRGDAHVGAHRGQLRALPMPHLGVEAPKGGPRLHQVLPAAVRHKDAPAPQRNGNTEQGEDRAQAKAGAVDAVLIN